MIRLVCLMNEADFPLTGVPMTNPRLQLAAVLARDEDAPWGRHNVRVDRS